MQESLHSQTIGPLMPRAFESSYTLFEQGLPLSNKLSVNKPSASPPYKSSR
ncbi:MAG: hypothetical protein ACJAWL_003319 [Motiliproteus sp.]|jgi:hypothetical protein